MKLPATKDNQKPVDRIAAQMRRIEDDIGALMTKMAAFIATDLPAFQADVTVYKIPMPGVATYAEGQEGALTLKTPEKGLHPVVLSDAFQWFTCALDTIAKARQMIASGHEEVRSEACSHGILQTDGGGGK